MKGIALSLAVAVCLTGSVRAQLTQLWHYQGQVNGSNWRSLAIGASGSQIVSNPDGGSGAVALFAGSDGPASPLIWSDTTAAQARTGIVAAASRDDAYANLYFNPVTGSGQSFVPRLTLRRSGNSATVWAKTYDAITISSTSILAGLHVARDGQKLVAWWFDHGQGKTFVVGYTASGAQNFAVALLTYVPPQASAADEDARRVALVYGNVTLVLDGTTGVQVKAIYPSQGSSTAVAFGPNADTLALGNVNGAVDVFRTGTALLGYAYTIPAVPSQVSRCATFSTDGSTLAVAYQSNLDIASHLLRIFTPGATNAVQVHQHAMHGNGSFISFITDVAVSDDGRVVAACTTGDQAQQLPSVLAFTRSPTGYILRGSAVLPGTAYDIDLSPDGRKAAVASSTMHYAMSTAVGTVDAFDIDGDLSVSGVPHAGTTVQVQMKTTPGLPCLLYMSNALHATPMDYGSMGSLLLQTPVRIGSTFADAQGVAHFNFSVPGGAEAWGDTYYTQGMTLIQRKLTQSYVPITVVP